MKRFALLALFAASPASAQYLDGLPAASAVAGSDIVPVCQGGTAGKPGTCVTRKATVGQVQSGTVSAAPVTATGTSTTNTLGTWMSYLAGVVNPKPYNTSSPLGYQQNGVTVLESFGNSGNVFGIGPGTDTLIGLGAGANLPTADYLTTAIGWHAMFANTSVNTESTAIGWSSQGKLTNGDTNTTIGINTLGSCVTSCNHNLLIGTDSMRNGLGSYQTGIGATTLINDSAGLNIAIGDATYQSNLSATGNLNIAIGWQTFQGLSLTSGSKNIIIGAGIAQNATSLSNSVVVGHQAGAALTSQQFDTFLGIQAGQHSVGNGSNVFIGANSASAATYGQQSTIIGVGVGSTTFGTGGPGTVSGVILLGSGAQTVDTPLSTTSNYINIENIMTVTGTGTPSSSVSQFAGTLNVVGGYKANGTAGVSCTAGTVSLTTMVVTNGIVTHC